MTASSTRWGQRPLWWWVGWLVVALALAGQSLRMRIAEKAVEDRNGAQVAAVRPQNGWGLAVLADQQFEQKQSKAALETSYRALVRTPLAASAVRTSARALEALEGPGAGEAAWQIASAMGWRDRQTQLWALLRALSNGEADIFVMRADALMRTRPDDQQMLSVIRQSLIEPQIRRVFVQRIAVDPEWRLRLFSSAALLRGRELEGSVQTLRDLAGTANRPGREELRDSILGLMAAGRFDEAVALDRQFVSRTRDAGTLLDDGGFESADTDYRRAATPFDWMIIRGASVDRSGGRKSLLVTKTRGSRPIVQRFVPLGPGRYRLSYSMQGQPEAGTSLGVQVRCARSNAVLGQSAVQPLASEGWLPQAVAFDVPPNCPVVRLLITSFGGEPTEALFDNFVLAPAS